jgi:hypothetical protein
MRARGRTCASLYTPKVHQMSTLGQPGMAWGIIGWDLGGAWVCLSVTWGDVLYFFTQGHTQCILKDTWCLLVNPLTLSVYKKIIVSLS